MDDSGRPSMVDTSPKEATKRTATATGRIYIPAIAYDLITSSPPTSPGNEHELGPLEQAKAKARRKGDPLTVAQLAAIMGSKRTSDLIPLCHPLALSHVSVRLTPEISEIASSGGDADSITPLRHSVLCSATVSCEGKTGVEMEALTAVTIGLLTVWDMLKAVAGKEMEIGEILVTHKSGGKSGDFSRESKN